MKRRQRKWTRGKLLEEPGKHPILALWDRPEVQEVIKNRGEAGIHFNDMRFLLCRDFREIKRPAVEWDAFSKEELKKMREYNDYTMLQKDLSKLCDIGLLNKEARGYYEPAAEPLMHHIRDISTLGRNLIGSMGECDILATESIDLEYEVKTECERTFNDIMEARALSFKSRILDFWNDVDSSHLYIQKKILLRSELYPFTKNEALKRLVVKECLISTKKGKKVFFISPFKKRNAKRLKKLIDITKKHPDKLGGHAVTYAMGMYSYPNIFTEEYISEKGPDFVSEMESYMQRLQDLLLDFDSPCYVILAPKK